MRPVQQTNQLEPLEPRIVLSNTYYAWTGVETLPGYDASHGVADTIVGASDDGRFLWSEAAADPTAQGETDEPYLVADGQVRYLRDIPALADAAIGGINSDGLVFARDVEGQDEGRLFLLDLLASGHRDYLDPDLLDAPPGFDLGLTFPLAITDAGGMVVSAATDSDSRDLWFILDHRVTHLWAGPPARGGFGPTRVALMDTNAANGVLGYATVENEPTPMLWTPQAGALDLTSVGITLVASLDNQGRVFALQDGQLVFWTPDAVTPVGYADSSWSPHPMSADGSGRVHVWHQHDTDEQEGYYTELSSPEGEIRMLEPGNWESRRALTESGLLLYWGWHGSGEPAGGWYAIVPNTDLVTGLAGDAVAAWIHGDTIALRIQSVYGTATQFTFDRAGKFEWISRTLGVEARDPYLEGPSKFRAILDPLYGQSLVLIAFENSYYGARLSIGGDAEVLGADFIDGITHGATGFFLSSRRPVVAGLDAEERLLLYYETNANPPGRRLADLSAHLATRGLDSPAFAGELGSFATTWGAMNIVGLDAAGDVHAVWWSPGLRSPLWTTTNLSALTGAPRLTGNLAATATPWGGMQIHGTDEQGHLVSLWWSPATGRWQVTDLTAELAGPALRAGSLDIATGRFGSINVVGATDAGEVVTYWWSHANGWEAKPVIEADDAPLFSGSVSYFVARSGEQHIAGVDAAGHVLDLYWRPDNTGWHWRDLTAMALA